MPASQPGRHEPDGGSPEEAFAFLGNDTRVGILKALWDAFESGRAGNPLPYPEQFAQVDVADSDGFSYHLEKLTGPFVRRYELNQTGITVVGAVVAGTDIDDRERRLQPVGRREEPTVVRPTRSPFRPRGRRRSTRRRCRET